MCNRPNARAEYTSSFELSLVNPRRARVTVVGLSDTQDVNSALMMAAENGHTDVVVELVNAGANLDLQKKVCSYI